MRSVIFCLSAENPKGREAGANRPRQKGRRTMKRLAVLVSLIVMTSRFATGQDGAADLEKKISELRVSRGEVERGLQQVGARLGLIHAM